MSRKMPIAAPYLKGKELEYATQAIESSWISSSGIFIKRFEADFAAIAEAESALAVANGTVALHLALLALGAGPGDEVIVPSLTYIATANAVRYVGAEPVFVDVEPETWCIDPDEVNRAITPRTVGVIAVDLYGHPADYDRLEALTRQHGLWLLEDAAEAIFATYKGRRTGSFGVGATFSFYGNKVITCGEGGAVTTSDPELLDRMRLIRNQGMDPERRYFFPVVGHNFRLTNVAAGILCAQLENAEEILERRLNVYRWYRNELSAFDGIEMQPIASWATVSPWLFSIVLTSEFGLERQALAAGLEKLGVETRPFFHPLHTLPPYVQARALDMPVTSELAGAGLNLPTGPHMSKEDVQYVVSCISAVRDAAGR